VSAFRASSLSATSSPSSSPLLDKHDEDLEPTINSPATPLSRCKSDNSQLVSRFVEELTVSETKRDISVQETQSLPEFPNVLRPTPQRSTSDLSFLMSSNSDEEFSLKIRTPSRRASQLSRRNHPYNLSHRSQTPCLTSPGASFIRPKSKLPVESNLDGLNSISCKTLAELVRGEMRDQYDKIIVADCRFDYEYKGGHIIGAIHCESPEQLNKMLFEIPPAKEQSERICVVFHCEFSVNRGPTACHYLRKRDREIHGFLLFPQLHYPELYIMNGGYRQFWSQFPELCEPRNYIKMEDEQFSAELKKCWKHSSWTRKGKGRSRASTQTPSPTVSDVSDGICSSCSSKRFSCLCNTWDTDSLRMRHPLDPPLLTCRRSSAMFDFSDNSSSSCQTVGAHADSEPISPGDSAPLTSKNKRKSQNTETSDISLLPTSKKRVSITTVFVPNSAQNYLVFDVPSRNL